MTRPLRDPMPVKYWSQAGLILTYWCNARCASCYVCSSPNRHEQMSVGVALRAWRQLQDASPRGCRVHLTGGEPFGDWPRLIEICRQAKREGLGPLEKVETNAFWAEDEQIVRQRVGELAEAGMSKLLISADPYHQQYVPIERCRLAARVAEDVLGSGRVQVRWRSWLGKGFDTGHLPAEALGPLLIGCEGYARDRMIGRAAALLARHLEHKSWQEFADNPCREALLRSRHVHVDPAARVIPGTCAGIVLGSIAQQTAGELWSRLEQDAPGRAVLGPLVSEGPVGLLNLAREVGFAPAKTYVSKCHMCWEIRNHLSRQGVAGDELSPGWMYLEFGSGAKTYNNNESNFT